MRYDSVWRQFGPPHRYDRGYRRQEPGRPGYGRELRQPYPAPRYDADFMDAEVPVLRGPERYGLGPYHERLRRRTRPDEELRENVREALFYDTWVDADAITVDVKDGVVTLRGDLPSYNEIRFATDDAWDVEGVHGVRTELRIKAD